MIHRSDEVRFIVGMLRWKIGDGRVSQTTCKKSRYYSVIRIYDSPADKGNPYRATHFCRTIRGLRIVASMFGINPKEVQR